MRIRECCVLPFLFSACLALASHCVAQEQPRPQGTAKPSSPREGKKRVNKKLRAELSDVDRRWLTEDVLYIISDDERRAFLELGTAEEREQFIEIFWRNRNPDQESPVNPIREEHYRRLAYADEHFASGVPGRKTDRGRMYIIWGPPDEIETHPSGGAFDRPLEQGVALRVPTRGSCGAIGIWKASARTSKLNLSIQADRVNTTWPATHAKKMRWHTCPARAQV